MAPRLDEYSRRSADLLNAARRLQNNAGNDTAKRRAADALLRSTNPGVADIVRYGFAPQPGARQPMPNMTDGLAAALYDVQAGNLLITAGLNQQETKNAADPDLFLQAQRQIDTSRSELLGTPVVSKFYGKISQASATIEAAAQGFRNYSDALLQEILTEVSTNVSLAGKGLAGLGAGGMGGMLGRIGEALPLVSDVGGLIKRGVDLVKNAIESLVALFGKDALQALQDKIGEILDVAGKIQDAALATLLGIGAAKKRIEEVLAAATLIGKVDAAANDLALVGTGFTTSVKTLRGILYGISLAGTIFGFLHWAGPWLATGLGIAFAAAAGATLLAGRAYTGAGALPGVEFGVVQLAGRIAAV